MNKYLFIGLAVLVAIIIIYFVSHLGTNGNLPDEPFKDSVNRMKDSLGRTYDSYFKTAEDMYEKTVGHINDDAAKMAFKKGIKNEEMHARNETTGKLSDKNLPKAAANAFMVGDLFQYNIAPNEEGNEGMHAAIEQANFMYGNAIRRLTTNPLVVVEAAREDAHIPAAEFMIDHYEDFIARQTMENPGLVEETQNRPNFDAVRNMIRGANIEAANNRAARGVAPKRPLRKKKKGVQLTEKQNAQDNYFEERDIRNDPQNVHEHQVNNDMYRIYRQLLIRNDRENIIIGHSVPKPKLQDIREYAKTHKFSDEKKRQRAIRTIDKMSEGNWIDRLKARENEILLNVWQRSNSPDNEGHQDDLRASLMDTLADCVETGYNGSDYQVCASGRTGRVLSSLTLLDQDQAISEPIKTTEVLRNEAFAKSYQIIQDALKETDIETARAYNGILESPAPNVDEKVSRFELELKNRIEDTLKRDYADTVNEKVLNNLIKDAQAGV